jgi:hypothetical protein
MASPKPFQTVSYNLLGSSPKPFQTVPNRFKPIPRNLSYITFCLFLEINL